MSDLRDLYQEVILDHGRRPRNFRRPEGADREAQGYNPICGDKISVYVKLKDDIVEDLGFEGSGCAISTASASMMTEFLKGKSRREIEAVFKNFHDMVTGRKQLSNGDLGKLAVFSTVSEFPMRVKCATLAWHTLQAALKGEDKTVTTE